MGFFELYMHYFSLDNLQTSLDVAGCVPVVGEPVDAVNAGIHVCRGNFGEAGLSAVSVIPVVGDYVGKSGKVGVFLFKKGDDVVGAAAAASKHLDEVVDGVQLTTGLSTGVLKLKNGVLEVSDIYVQGADDLLEFADKVRHVAKASDASSVTLKGVEFGFGTVAGKASDLQSVLKKMGAEFKKVDETAFGDVYDIVFRDF